MIRFDITRPAVRFDSRPRNSLLLAVGALEHRGLPVYLAYLEATVYNAPSRRSPGPCYLVLAVDELKRSSGTARKEKTKYSG